MNLKPINIKKITFEIIGTTSMIQHAWSAKAKAQLAMTAIERKKQPKTARDPMKSAQDATYFTDAGDYGIPAMAFKAALIGAAHKDLGIEKTMVRKAFFMKCTDKNMVLKINADDPILREDNVRVGQNQADVRYRPEFVTGWTCRITAEIDADILNEENIANLVNRAGFGVGIGEWRPEKGGDFGRFELNTAVPVKTMELK